MILSRIWGWIKSFVGGCFEILGAILSSIGDILGDIDFPDFGD